MSANATMTKFPAARVFIILGVLVSLCVSDNVGPRLLPLVTELASGPNLTGPGQAASRAPSRGRTVGARVEMVSAAQSRAGAERQSPQAVPHALKFELAVSSGPIS